MPSLRPRTQKFISPSERVTSLRSHRPRETTPPRNSPQPPSTPTKRAFNVDSDDEPICPPAPKKKKRAGVLGGQVKAKQAENRPREGLNTRPLDEKVSGSSKNTFKSEEEEDSARHYPSPAPSSPISEAGTEYVVVLTEDAKAPKAPVTIDSLPTEVVQMVMNLLPEDMDVACLAQSSRRFYAISGRSVWVQRFNQTFDHLPVQSLRRNKFFELKNNEAERHYKIRQALMNRRVNFAGWVNPERRAQEAVVNVLLGMISESNGHTCRTDRGHQVVTGKNLDWIFEYFVKQKANLLDFVIPKRATHMSRKGKEATNLELTVKICLTHLMLNPKIPAQINSFIISQVEAYQCITKVPIFQGRNGFQVNFQWLQHVANFFRHHLRAKHGEGLLTHVFESLPDKDLPRAWPGKLENKTMPLGHKWKGAFTYISEDSDLRDLRRNTLEETAEDETSEANNGFQDLTIFNNIEGKEELQWTDAFENELKGEPRGTYYDEDLKKDVTPTHKDFFGLGVAQVQYHLWGRIHSLPSQSKIPGFMRVTMMKELPEEGSGAYGPGLSQMWAYEGCVLPGGQIILGRWWSPAGVAADSYSGPFIFWQVSNDEGDREDISEAVAFMENPVAKNTLA